MSYIEIMNPLDDLNIIKTQQQTSMLELFVRTGFFSALPYYLNYIRGLERRQELTAGEIRIIENISRNPSISHFYELNNIININTVELYLVMLLHSQRGFNHQNSEDIEDTSIEYKREKYRIEDELRTLARNSLSTSFINVDPDEIDTLAVFGATYSTMKLRATSGIRLFMDINKRKPKDIVLLTGFRDAYFSELKQLGITKINNRQFNNLQNVINLERKNKNGPVRVMDVVDYFKSHPKLDIDRYVDRTQLLIVLNKLSKFGIKFPKNIEILNTIDLLYIFAKRTKERELGYLAMLDAGIYSEYNFASIYTNDRNDTTGRRANTQDTIKAFLNKGYEVGKTLFVSNDLLTQQQHIAAIDVVNNFGDKSVNTIGIPIRENYFYLANKSNPNPALNSIASSLYCACNMAINELSDIDYNINNLKNACNGVNARKININGSYSDAYRLGYNYDRSIFR